MWTKVLGVIKIVKDYNEKELRNILGNIVTFDEMANNDFWFTNMPIGSEGSLSYNILDDYIIFDSNLRDFYRNEEMQELYEYFDNILETLKNKGMIHNFLIQVRNENVERYWESD